MALMLTVMDPVPSRNSLLKVALVQSTSAKVVVATGMTLEILDQSLGTPESIPRGRVRSSVDSLLHPNRAVCGIVTYEGVGHCALASAGCWKNEP